MKDLWSDLEVTENDLDADNMGWSLEQLERELAYMEDQPPLEPPPSASSVPLTTTAAATTTLPPPLTGGGGPPPGLSAASLVVSHAQERQSGNLYGTPQPPQLTTPQTTTTTLQGVDAWSQSLEKFTALSLEEDFLKADSARKQTPQSHPPPTTTTNSAIENFLSNASEYDVSEPMILGATSSSAAALKTMTTTTTPLKPPGMPSPQKTKPIVQNSPLGMPPPPVMEEEQDNNKVEQEEQVVAAVPPPVPVHPRAPPTPPNSMATTTRSTPPTPQNSFNSGGATPRGGPPPPPGATVAAMGMIVPPPVVPPGAGMPMMMTPQGPVPMGMVPQPPPPPMGAGATPTMTGRPGPSPPGAPTVSGGPAWQSSPQPPPVPTQRSPHPAGGAMAQLPPALQQRIFCQSHPSAPPIPATHLESAFMKSRDISYVLHSMLKPVLAAGVSPDDYHMQLLTRNQRVAAAAAASAAASTTTTPRKGQKGTGTSNGGKDDKEKSVVPPPTPQEKSKQWMQEKSILGHTSRTDVTRPRALIAASMTVEQQDEHHQKRATLWKSRLVTDKAYQAFSNLVEIWKASPPGKVPPYTELQPHMVRLFKYLGIVKKQQEDDDNNNNTGEGHGDDTPASTTYEVNDEALALLLKLPKGRTLLSRVLEQALLPPNAVQTLFPSILKNVLPLVGNSANTTATATGESAIVDDRLFRSLARILSGLPHLEPTILTQSSQAFLQHPQQAFSTTSRMECVHALLRRGSTMAATSSNPQVQQEWTRTEEQFLELIGAM